jgi:serine/threonine protein kinase
MAKVLLAVHNAETDEAKTQELSKYTASVAYDLWSFGVVLFHLCYGISLFNTDQNDNVSLRDLSSLAGWTPRLLNLKIKDANKHSTPESHRKTITTAAFAPLPIWIASIPIASKKEIPDDCLPY